VPFQKGQSGNPGGRPKSLEAFRDWLAKTREQRQHALMELLASDDERIRLEALKHCDAYDYGKPTQAVEVSGTGGEAIPIRIIHPGGK
jgi:hypothetical protein